MKGTSGNWFFNVGRFCEAAELLSEFGVNFDPMPPGGPRSVVAAAMRQTDATGRRAVVALWPRRRERVPPILNTLLGKAPTRRVGLQIFFEFAEVP